MLVQKEEIDLTRLNPEQRKAVETVNGRVLILAGAGSGKTRVLTVRIAHLIQQHHVPPEQILGLTFTNKAAGEMRQRVAEMVPPEVARKLTLCTFHSFCMKVLREDITRLGYTRDFTLYDPQDVERLATAIARDILKHESTIPSLGPMVAAISLARNRDLSPEEISGTGSDWHDGFTQKVYRRLIESMRAHNAVDFDSLLSLTVQLFREHPDVLLKYQERYRYLMIDEYQDTSPVQYQIAHLLSQRYQNLCVVGDDDQSIYGWRGADVANILGFDQAVVIRLEQNYRSSNTILQSANAVISNNSRRHDKKLWSDRGQGEKIHIFHAPSDIDEAQAVVGRIAHMRMSLGLDWKDFAILYRSNALSRQFELALMKHSWKKGDHWIRGIPYQIYGGQEFYERREIKDLIAYLRVIVNPLDQAALLRIVNFPRRGIGDKALDVVTAENRREGIPLWDMLVKVADDDQLAEKLELTKRSRGGIRQFITIIQEAQEYFANDPMPEAMSTLLGRLEYQKALNEEVKSDKMQDFKWENVQEFVSAMAEYEMSPSESGEECSLLNFLSSSALQSDNVLDRKRKKEDDDQVNLMTFHAAKGLEFPACFLVALEDHIIPHERSLNETGLEEERRLMYVALTRCKRYLTCSMAQKRMRMGRVMATRPSRFLFEIPPEYLQRKTWNFIGDF